VKARAHHPIESTLRLEPGSRIKPPPHEHERQRGEPEGGRDPGEQPGISGGKRYELPRFQRIFDTDEATGTADDQDDREHREAGAEELGDGRGV
jgi:hypothetical protein